MVDIQCGGLREGKECRQTPVFPSSAAMRKFTEKVREQHLAERHERVTALISICGVAGRPCGGCLVASRYMWVWAGELNGG